MFVGTVNPEGKRCDGCVYYIGSDWDPQGICRRHAPNPNVARTHSENWCGDWADGERPVCRAVGGSPFEEGVADAIKNGQVNMEPGGLTPFEEMPDGSWRVRGLRESGPT